MAAERPGHGWLGPTVAGAAVPNSPPPGKLWLRNDAGTGWLGPVAAGTTAKLTNTRCSIDAAGSSWTGTGPDLTVRVAVRFTANFRGTRNISMKATDKSGAGSGWQKRGVWTVP